MTQHFVGSVCARVRPGARMCGAAIDPGIDARHCHCGSANGARS